MKRTRRIPATSPCRKQAREVPARGRRIAIAVHILAEKLHFGIPRIGERLRFRSTLSLVRLRSGPRVKGTTQYAHALSHPSMIVMYARCGLSRRVNGVSKVSLVSRLSPVTRRFPASS